jgi:hypothetical protein
MIYYTIETGYLTYVTRLWKHQFLHLSLAQSKTAINRDVNPSVFFRSCLFSEHDDGWR